MVMINIRKYVNHKRGTRTKYEMVWRHAESGARVGESRSKAEGKQVIMISIPFSISASVLG